MFINDLLSNYLVDVDGKCMKCETDHVPIYNVENINDKNDVRPLYSYCEKCIKKYYKRRISGEIDTDLLYSFTQNNK